LIQQRSYRFTHTLSRQPGPSCVDGLRSDQRQVPDHPRFLQEQREYLDALGQAGVETIVLPALNEYPDSVFVEDVALCVNGTALMLRPGADSRLGEAAASQSEFEQHFPVVSRLPGEGRMDGGDILLTDNDAFVGISSRTDGAAFDALLPVLETHAYRVRAVQTPSGVLHFKSDCALLDENTILATARLAEADCFGPGYRVLTVPADENAAANLIRVNDFVIMRSGFPKTHRLLQDNGYRIIQVRADEAARLDGGLSCMSLRFALA